MAKYFEYGETELMHLRKKDKKLGAAIDRMGIIRREVNPDIFSALVESIVGQQISNKAAVTVCRRLNELCSMDSHRLHALSRGRNTSLRYVYAKGKLHQKHCRSRR
jgi:3-methyladenine DNA glycosylase/8-oxoguanine DNA glycosylase